jgi:predicted RNA-binding Zn-ribbon protein involved in translation (DUF1610 family)
MSTFMDHCASCGASITLDEGDIGHRLACYACGRRYYVCEGGWLAPDPDPPGEQDSASSPPRPGASDERGSSR